MTDTEEKDEDFALRCGMCHCDVRGRQYYRRRNSWASVLCWECHLKMPVEGERDYY